MDALRQMTEKRKLESQGVSGERKFFKRGELEESRLKKLREEEEAERAAKETKRKVQEQSHAPAPSKAARVLEETRLQQEELVPMQEVIRRLRALRQPATLFGEEEPERLKRLRKAESEFHVDEDSLGGVDQSNSLLELQRKDLARHKAQGMEDGERAKAAAEKLAGEQLALATSAAAAAAAEDPTVAAFRRAAAELSEQREEARMTTEQRVGKYLKRWNACWGEDLDRRTEAVKNSILGRQTTVTFQQTQQYFDPLYKRLRQRSVPDELVVGMWMMVLAIKERNYLMASDIYLKLAIGNAPWPIGVTSVGIHERSAREKISHVMNESGQAHIMNDEATRKYLQAIKRLITFMQRLFPTDPSRCLEFSAVAEDGRGSTGHGSDKLALLDAEEAGQDWRSLGLAPAPHFVEHDGTIMVPTKWSNTLRRATESEVAKDVTREATRVQDAATAASQAQTRAAQESLNTVVQ
ncbi:MAG: hypothetical protein WDW36_007527 [Sanguina aurantia]